MVPGSSEPPESFDRQFAEKDDLVFLRDEGLEVLALFKSIKDKQKRLLVVELIRALAEGQPAD